MSVFLLRGEYASLATVCCLGPPLRLLRTLELIFNVDVINRKSRLEERCNLRLQILPAQRNQTLVIEGVNGPSEGEL